MVLEGLQGSLHQTTLVVHGRQLKQRKHQGEDLLFTCQVSIFHVFGLMTLFCKEMEILEDTYSPHGKSPCIE